jgi:hypothetical protein
MAKKPKNQTPRSSDDMAAEWAKSNMAGGMPEDPEGGMADQAGGERISKSQDSEDEKPEPAVDDAVRWNQLAAKMAEGELTKSEQQELNGLLLKAKKSDEDEDEAEEDETEDQEKQEGEQGEEAEGEKSEKSLASSETETIPENVLEKSLDALEQAAAGEQEATPDRRAELGAKMATGELTKSEEQELFDLLKSATATEETEGVLSKSKTTAEQFASNPTVSEAYEVAPFLRTLGDLLGNSLDEIKGDLVKSEASRRTFNIGLAKALHGVGRVVQESAEMIKSLQRENSELKDRLESVEQAPMPFKGRTGTGKAPSAKPLRKSFAGGDDDQLSYDQVDRGLELLLSKSLASGRGTIAPCGIDLGGPQGMSKWESAHVLPRELLDDVKKALSGE